MQESRDRASHSSYIPKCKVGVWSSWDAPWRVFQAREYTQLNLWVPLWTTEMCKLGIFIYASSTRCVFLPHILQAASGNPSAVRKMTRQSVSFQQSHFWHTCWIPWEESGDYHWLTRSRGGLCSVILCRFWNTSSPGCAAGGVAMRWFRCHPALLAAAECLSSSCHFYRSERAMGENETVRRLYRWWSD